MSVNLKELCIVGAGGAMGSVLRYIAAGAVTRGAAGSLFPYGTFAVNVTGCAAIGLLAALLERAPAFPIELRLFLITGILGGFTTFSAFALETATLLRAGNSALAIVYCAGSVAAGLAALFLAFRLAAPS